MRRLSEDEYLATMESQPEPVDDEQSPPFDFWPYFEALPPAEFGGHDFTAGRVPYAWRMPRGQWEHVLIADSVDHNTFLVLVLNLASTEVHGHYLLRLAEKYGLDE